MEEEFKERLLRIGEAARLLGVHRETLRRWEREGKIKPFRIGEKRERRYDPNELLKLLEVEKEEE